MKTKRGVKLIYNCRDCAKRCDSLFVYEIDGRFLCSQCHDRREQKNADKQQSKEEGTP